METPATPTTGSEVDGSAPLTDRLEFITFAQYADQLAEAAARPLSGVTDLDGVLRLARLLTAVGKNARNLSESVRRELSSRSEMLLMGSRLTALCGQVDEFATVIEGSKPAQGSLADLSHDLTAWIDSVPRFLSDLDSAEERFEAEMRLRRTLDRIELTMHSTWLSPLAPEWDHVRGATLSVDAETQGPLADFIGLWSFLPELLPNFIRHYGLSVPDDIGKVDSADSLAEHLQRLVSWLDRDVAPKLAEATLPPIPNIGYPWLRRPILDLAWKIEVQLAPRRTISMAANEVLLGLWQLAGAARNANPEFPRLSTADAELVTALLDRCVGGSEFPRALSLSCDLASEQDWGLLGAAVARAARNHLWRLPSPDQLVNWSERERSLVVTAVRKARSEQPGDIPLVSVLHAAARCDGFTGRANQFGDFAELARMGSIGAWVFTAYLEQSGRGIDEGLLHEHFSRGDDLALDLALPVCQLSNTHAETEEMRLLLAGLELSYPPNDQIVNDKWVAQAAEIPSQRFPVIQNKLRRLRECGPEIRHGGEQYSDELDASAATMADAMRAAQQELHPRKYRGISSLARVATDFVHEVASPLLQKATSVDETGECEALVRQIANAADNVEGWLTAALEVSGRGKFRFPLRNVVADCQDMLARISEFVTARQEFLAAGGQMGQTRQDLTEELDQLCEWGWVGRQAARLLRHRFGVDVNGCDVASSQLPGHLDEVYPDLWLLPRCLDKWRRGFLSLYEYVSAMDEDLGGESADVYAIRQADDLECSWGRIILDHLRDVSSESRELFNTRLSEWRDYVGLDWDKLQEKIKRLPGDLHEEETLLLKGIEDELARDSLLEASRSIEGLNRLISEPGRWTVDAGQLLKGMEVECEARLDLLENSRERVADKNAYRTLYRRLLDFLERVKSLSQEPADQHALELKPIRREWQSLEAEIAVSMPVVPVLAETNVAAAPSAPADVRIIFPAAGRGVYWGVVKRRAKKECKGFITAFDSSLLRSQGDVYFEGEWYEGDWSEVAVGSLVEFNEVSREPGRTQQQAKRVRPLEGPADLENMKRQLYSLDPDYDSSIGIIVHIDGERRVMNELSGPLPIGPGSLWKPVETVVRFEVRTQAAIVTAIVDPAGLCEERRRLLQKLAFSPAQPVLTSPLPLGQTLQPNMLRSLNPFHPLTIRQLREIKEDLAHDESARRMVVETIQKLISEKFTNASWLLAAFVDILVDHCADSHAIRTLLEMLAQSVEEWRVGNFDVTLHEMHVRLDERVSPSGTLSADELFLFFERVQERLGNNPNFRIELILARILIDHTQEFYFRFQDPLQEAEQHVKRSLSLNGRQTEALDLLRGIEQARHQGEVALSPRTRESWDTLPENPVDRIQFFQDYYRRPDLTLSEAQQRFDEWRLQVDGAVLEELLLLHVNLLLRYGSRKLAYDLVLNHALSGVVSVWGRLLQSLFDCWRVLDIDFAEVEVQAKDLAKRASDDEYTLNLLIARLAEERRDFYNAEIYAKAARKIANSREQESAEATRVLLRIGTIDDLDDVEMDQGEISKALKDAGVRGREEMLRLVSSFLKKVEDKVAVLRELWQRPEGEVPNVRWDDRMYICRELKDTIPPGLRLDLFAATCEIQARRYVEDFRYASGLRPGSMAAPLTTQPFRDMMQTHSDPSLSTPHLAQAMSALLEESWLRIVALETFAEFTGATPDLHYHLALACSTAERSDFSTQAGRDYAKRLYVRSLLLGREQFERERQGSVADRLAAEWKGLAVAAAASYPILAPAFRDQAVLCARQAFIELVQSLTRPDDEWIAAVDGIFRSLVSMPSYWGAASAVAEVVDAVTSAARRDDPAFAVAVIRMALDLVLMLRSSPGGNLAELLVLEAMLHKRLVGLDPNSHWTVTIAKCEDLCRQADILAGGEFGPAWDLRQSIQQESKPPDPWWEGVTVLGGYRILSTRRPGASGQVFRAQFGDQMVALKRLNLTIVGEDAAARRRRFEQEADFHRELTHPSIPQFVRYYEQPPTIVMQWIEGKTVREMINEAAQIEDWRFGAAVATQIASALQWACDVVARRNPEYRFAHRDIHSDNVMIVRAVTPADCKAYILDFEFSRRLNAILSDEVEGLATKDLRYRDPEWPHGGLRGDCFSLGVVLYELLFRYHPYDEDLYYAYKGRTDVHRPTREEVERSSHAPQTWCAPLAAILGKMVALDPRDRYQSWDALLADLSMKQRQG